MTDLDPMLREAMARVRGPINTRPSLTDIRRRARRRNRRRMAVTASAVACTGVATAALIIRRDSSGSPAAGISADTASPEAATTVYLPAGEFSTTTVYPAETMTITASAVWDALSSARNDPSGVALLPTPPDQEAAQRMPTAEQFGCTSGECGAMFTYVVWHEIARQLGFGDVGMMQSLNASIDFSQPPREGDVLQSANAYPAAIEPTTSSSTSIFDGVVLIDGGAPAEAMEDAYQRLAGFDRTIVAGTGKSVNQTEVMPIRDHDSIAAGVAGLLGIDGFDAWDPSFAADPIEGMVAVIIGPDYWDRVQTVASTTTTTIAPTTTSIG